MLPVMILTALVLLFMVLDWIWFNWIFGQHMDRFWSVMAFTSASAGYAFGGSNEGHEWAVIISIFMYILSAIMVVVGIGKWVSRKT
jgi:nucleoside permease NupC